MREVGEVKPLPDQGPADGFPGPVYEDDPLVSQHPPEERAFVGAYEHVGRPRILVFVNRTLDGQVMPVTAEPPGRNGDRRNAADSYLHPGQYDDASARSLDYEAVETVLSDWLGAGGRVQIVSPIMVRQRLSSDQVKDLQAGRPRMLGELAKDLDADILIQAQVRPTRQTEYGLEFRMVAEAVNVKGGESLARAVVDMPAPLDKPRINKYTRFVVRKLMDGMIAAWESSDDRPHDAARGDEPRREPASDAATPPSRRPDSPAITIEPAPSSAPAPGGASRPAPDDAVPPPPRSEPAR